MSDWIKVEDNLPMQGEIVDVFFTKGEGFRICNCFWDKRHADSDEWYWAKELGDPYFTGGIVGGITELEKTMVSHWMATPPKPDQT